MTYCVGLTGNIASGKSTVASLFATLGVQVLNADVISKQLTSKGTAAHQAIIQHYGSAVVDDQDQLNRKKLRELIFSNPKERLWLEQLLHPMIRQQLAEQVTVCTTPYCIIEIPLSIDKNNYPYLNKILLVISPIEQQIERLMHRDQCTKAQALAIISAQPSIEQRRSNADDVLINDDGMEQLCHEVKQLHQNYCVLVKQRDA